MRTSSLESNATTTLDARSIAPGDRDAVILSIFHHLAAGQSMELVHEHEPKQLFSKLRSAAPSGFDWHCVEAGPAIWRIRIRRLATWWADGQCCGTCGAA